MRQLPHMSYCTQQKSLCPGKDCIDYSETSRQRLLADDDRSIKIFETSTGCQTSLGVTNSFSEKANVYQPSL